MVISVELATTIGTAIGSIVAAGVSAYVAVHRGMRREMRVALRELMEERDATFNRQLGRLQSDMARVLHELGMSDARAMYETNPDLNVSEIREALAAGAKKPRRGF